MKVVMDCDTGHDDALAILLAARHLDLIGVTTVFGSSTVANTTDNTLRVLALVGLDVPVIAGCGAPMLGTTQQSAPTHGRTGLDGAQLPSTTREPEDCHAVDFLIDAARKYREELVMVATGPLTNLAIALRKEPRLASWIGEVSIMGGSAGVGNRTPAAEANFASDPEAASIVLAAGMQCHLVGYDLTRTFGLTEDDIATLAASESAVAQAVAGLQQFYLLKQREIFGLAYAPIHDPCAVLRYVSPSSIEYESTSVQIELAGKWTRGMSVYDRRGVPNPEGCPVQRATSIDVETAISAVLAAVKSYT